MAGDSRGNPAPAWAIPVAIVLVVLIIGLFAWRSLGRNPAASDLPPLAAHPGDFNIQKAAAEGHLGNGLKNFAAGKQ